MSAMAGEDAQFADSMSQEQRTDAHTKERETIEAEQDDVGEIAPMEEMTGPPLDIGALEVGFHFQDIDYFVYKVQKYAQDHGFVVCKDGKFFSWRNPHPVHPDNYKLLQRTTIYCNNKDPENKRSQRFMRSCPWKVRVLYDRGTLDYMVTEVSLEHNHDLGGSTRDTRDNRTNPQSQAEDFVIDVTESASPRPDTGAQGPVSGPRPLIMGKYRLDQSSSGSNAPPRNPSGARGANKRPLEYIESASSFAPHAQRRPFEMGREPEPVRGHAIPHAVGPHPSPPVHMAPHATSHMGQLPPRPASVQYSRGAEPPPPNRLYEEPPPRGRAVEGHPHDVYLAQEIKRCEMEMKWELERQQVKGMEFRREIEKQRFFIELQQHDRLEKEAAANQRILDAKAKEAELHLRVAKLKAKQELIDAGVAPEEIEKALGE
ncbi:hypothetical protein LEN26_001287 [Aphanomyces euteiches]|nr:hypothetical protein LEN26_001287 [Aphanomyces euteiches]